MLNEISNDQLSMRDRLAIARTLLANERTLLAYWRTALAFLITGFSLIRFFHSVELAIIGWALIPISVTFVFIGFKRFRRMSRSIDAMKPKHTN